MKKQINATGVNGTFTGFVQVKLNDPTDGWYKVLGTAEKAMVGFIVLDTDSYLMGNVDQMELDVKSALWDMAAISSEPTSIESQLKAKGFV